MSAHFLRTVPPPPYKHFREITRLDFRLFCAYCLINEADTSGPEWFDLDHFRPKSRFPKLAKEFSNHYYCCKRCNGIKRDLWDKALEEKGIGFVDLCSSLFEEHYKVQEDQGWLALSISAQYTIDKLRLDAPSLLSFRRKILLRRKER